VGHLDFGQIISLKASYNGKDIQLIKRNNTAGKVRSFIKSNMIVRNINGSGTYNLSYDAENRLVGVSGPSTNASFVYDGDGRRVKATVNGVTTAYIGNHFEWTGSTSTMVKYYYAGGVRVAMRVGSSTLYYLFGDHLGSTSLSYRSDGGQTVTQLYKAWGEVRYSSGGLPTKYTFTGQYSHVADFGLLFYNARWYDPYLNRWIQPDDIIPDQYNPLDWDRLSSGT